ncbi:hypothetical protein DID96_12685 [Burkholderia sp. Bp8963]|nr:hypothetical protein DID96_12685 [Burkholderia sp. Bp8963]
MGKTHDAFRVGAVAPGLVDTPLIADWAHAQPRWRERACAHARCAVPPRRITRAGAAARRPRRRRSSRSAGSTGGSRRAA